MQVVIYSLHQTRVVSEKGHKKGTIILDHLEKLLALSILTPPEFLCALKNSPGMTGMVGLKKRTTSQGTMEQ